MSGFEIAGVVLGALPILFEAIDWYKNSIHRAGVAFRRRKHVDKLARALLLQKQTLEETVKSIIVASGCEDIWRLEDDPLGYLNDENVQSYIGRYLGSNDSAFIEIIKQSNDVVKEIARNIAGLVPSYKDPTDDLLTIIKANHDHNNSNRLNLMPRVKLAVGAKELKSAIQDLDQTTNALDRFARIVFSNRQAMEGISGRAVKLANALLHVRGFSNSLYFAIIRCWKTDCHDKHEARLFLDDRLDGSAEILKQIAKESSAPVPIFQVIFAASLREGPRQCHETIVRVFNHDTDNNNDDDHSNRLCLSGCPKATTAMPQRVSQAKPKVTVVSDICGTIEAATQGQHKVAFVLTKSQQMGAVAADQETLIPHHQADTVTLESLLRSAHNSPPHRGPVLPLKFRMLLALRIASNFIQLFHTKWLGKALSKDAVHFPFRSTVGDTRVDVGRPFVAFTSDSAGRDPRQQQEVVKPKAALLELGILLLEIWHEMTLETRFSLPAVPDGHYERLALAAQWLDDMQNPLPDLYDRAVSFCVGRIIGADLRFPIVDDTRFWHAVCDGVIDPLWKNCKQWR